jgi:S-adenosylmethionine:tRNA ribosyltransferase-isomerase
LKRIDHIDLSLYTYTLPEDRIAAFPAGNREDSKLLIARDGEIKHDIFSHLPDYIGPGRQMVMNNSRVIPARLIFTRPTGSKIELFCLSPVDPLSYDQALGSKNGCTWSCMAGNVKRFVGPFLEKQIMADQGTVILKAEKIHQHGNLLDIRFSWDNPHFTFGQILQDAGKTPLPPYIKRKAVDLDKERYQTVYSKLEGSVAAPTAGLHFTKQVINELAGKNVGFHEVTLHVGAGTFQPIKSASIHEHVMHAEIIQSGKDFIEFMSGCKSPLIAVGTTSVRTLESLYWLGVKILTGKAGKALPLTLDQWEAYSLPCNFSLNDAFSAIAKWMDRQGVSAFLASTRLIIVPGYTFKTVNRLITNFHQPGSTLLLLVAAFAGDQWKDIYQYALDNDFRFLSYGDSSILNLTS